ncbi:TIGR00266 family protein [Desulfobacterales bacterium HSG17]|nr:TIGR00266 family protein [Desulfobacterales bacterium HSG17]
MADMFADFKKGLAEKQTPQDQPGSGPAPSPQGSSEKNYEYLHRGAFTMLKVKLNAGEKIKAEADAMVAMSPNVSVEGKMEGGLLGGFGRMLTGEKFFFQTLHAQQGPGDVYLSPAIPGDIMEIEMDGITSYTLQKDGFFAGSEGLTVSTKMQNLGKGLFSGEGFFVINVSGKGTLFVSSYGSIHPMDLAAGEEIIIDNCHLVAWPENMQYNIEKASAGWISSFTSGEGMVCRFRGPGRVLIQTRNPRGFGSWIRQFMPVK